MLILTRHADQSIIIGDDIVVRILGVKGGQIRIGITAPKQISVHREEIWKRIHDQQKITEYHSSCDQIEINHDSA